MDSTVGVVSLQGHCSLALAVELHTEGDWLLQLRQVEPGVDDEGQAQRGTSIMQTADPHLAQTRLVTADEALYRRALSHTHQYAMIR